jgi:hypothetical protein
VIEWYAVTSTLADAELWSPGSMVLLREFLGGSEVDVGSHWRLVVPKLNKVMMVIVLRGWYLALSVDILHGVAAIAARCVSMMVTDK